jgi:hypothetical protein
LKFSKKKPKNAPLTLTDLLLIFLGPGGGGPNFIILTEFLFILVRSPCKNLKSYDNPFWDFNNGGKKRENKTRRERKKFH